VPPLQSTRPF